MKKRILVLILLIVSLSVFGCAKISDLPMDSSASGMQDPKTSAPEDSTVEPEKDETIIVDKGDQEPGPEENKSEGQINEAVITANREFSWNLFKKINTEDSSGNVFISPYSIANALTMALNGAEGNTRVEMEKALQVAGVTRDDLNRAYAAEANRLSKLDKKVTLQNANSIWLRDSFQVKKDFIDRNKAYLGAEVQTLDFSDPSSVGVINNWVSDKTNRLIPSIISPPISTETIMYLINAIYFKGEWTTEFKQENTQEKDFYALDGKTDKVQMMFRGGKIDYLNNDELQAVRLPYGDEKVSMVVILPKKDLNSWIDSMNGDKWKGILTGFNPVSDLQLQIPKFKMEYGIKELNGVLKELGMREAFSDGADFSGIANNLFISQVLHKAVVDVNEQGTEAAAVTAVVMQVTSFIEPVSFTADRPFFFAIVDNEQGNLLFMGKKIAGDRD
ncbi:MAG: serpin family protein [Ruminiclostridium sp.]|nr:serpin family protein [Ruminiclostridium sp.]